MSNANSQDSSNPKSPTEDSVESPPHQLAPSVGTLPVNSIVSAGTSLPASVSQEVPLAPKHISMIQKGGLTRREIKKLTREMHLAEAITASTPEYLGWSDQDITFGLDDHPSAVPRPGHAALVVEAQIGGFHMSKVFMDGGSGLNLIFTTTLRAMGIPPEALSPSDTSFYGIIPSGPACSHEKFH